MLEVSGVNQVITVDIHSPQTEGFFSIPVDCLTARFLFERSDQSNVLPAARVAASVASVGNLARPGTVNIWLLHCLERLNITTTLALSPSLTEADKHLNIVSPSQLHSYCQQTRVNILLTKFGRNSRLSETGIQSRNFEDVWPAQKSLAL